MDSLKTYGSDSDSGNEPEDEIPEDTIHKFCEKTTVKISEDTTDKISEDTTDKISEDTTDKISEDTTDKISEDTTDKISEDTTDKKSEIITQIVSDKICGETTDRTSGQAIDNTSGKTTHQISERPTHRISEEAPLKHLPHSDKIQSEILGSTGTENILKKEILDSSEPSNTVYFNFLGLERPTETKSNVFRGSQTLRDQSEIRKVQTNWGEVEIPNGDFWTDFQPDMNPLQTDFHSDINPIHKLDNSYHTKQIGKTCISKSCGITPDSHLLHVSNSPHSQNFSQYQNSHQSQNQLQLHSLKRVSHRGNNSDDSEISVIHNKQARPSHQSSRLSHNCLPPPSDQTAQRQGFAFSSNNQQNKEPNKNSLESQPIANEKRKPFYVHSKVAPYVNITPTNKCASRRLTSWPAHHGVINRLAWNIPSFSHLLVTAGMDTFVKVWNVWSTLDPCVARLSSHKKAVKHVEWCPNGRTVLSCSYDRTAQVTDVETAKVLGTYEHTGFVTAGHIHPSNPNLFVTGTDNLIVKWDMRTPQAPVKHFSYKDKFGQVQDLLFINNGQEFVSSSDLVSRDCADRTLMVWDLRIGSVLSNQIYQELYVCTRLKIHPHSSTFLAQSHAGYVALFSTTPPYKMDKSKRYEGHKVEGHSIGFDISPDGSLVYSGSAGNDVHCYHQNSGRLLRKLSCKHDIVTDVECHPVLPSCLASCTWGGSVSLWM